MGVGVRGGDVIEVEVSKDCVIILVIVIGMGGLFYGFCGGSYEVCFRIFILREEGRFFFCCLEWFYELLIGCSLILLGSKC